MAATFEEHQLLRLELLRQEIRKVLMTLSVEMSYRRTKPLQNSMPSLRINAPL